MLRFAWHAGSPGGARLSFDWPPYAEPEAAAKPPTVVAVQPAAEPAASKQPLTAADLVRKQPAATAITEQAASQTEPAAAAKPPTVVAVQAAAQPAAGQQPLTPADLWGQQLSSSPTPPTVVPVQPAAEPAAGEQPLTAADLVSKQPAATQASLAQPSVHLLPSSPQSAGPSAGRAPTAMRAAAAGSAGSMRALRAADLASTFKQLAQRGHDAAGAPISVQAAKPPTAVSVQGAGTMARALTAADLVHKRSSQPAPESQAPAEPAAGAEEVEITVEPAYLDVPCTFDE